MHTIISSRLKFTEHHFARTITINNFTTETETWTRTIFYEFFLFFLSSSTENVRETQFLNFPMRLLRFLVFSSSDFRIFTGLAQKAKLINQTSRTKRKQRKQQIVQSVHKQIWSPMNPPTNCCELLQNIEDIGRRRSRWVEFWWNICWHTHLQHIYIYISECEYEYI